jgi:peptide/nickel transport system permease protein
VENATRSWKLIKDSAHDAWPIQYIRYLGHVVRFDYGFSFAHFPTPAWEIVAPALPWTLILLSIAAVLSFIIGITIGSLMGWRKTPGWLQSILPVSLTSSIPYFMFGILVISTFWAGCRLPPAPRT